VPVSNPNVLEPHHTPPNSHRRVRGRGRDGQSLVEFALVFPIMMMMIGGVIQFGLIFWTQSTLTQVVADTGRWAATQKDCTNTAPVIATANSIASRSTLLGYSSGSWTGSQVSVTWQRDGTKPCPTTDNGTSAYVTISVAHSIPVFFPWLPGNGGLTASAKFRMEPAQ
jgi:Flp pilus assembly protein TadG